MDKDIDKPTELHKENLPPTQSHIGKIFSELIPYSIAFSTLLLTAIKCFEISFSLADFKNQLLTEFAFVSVSIVVKVFETIMKIVVSGLTLLNTSFRWSPSTLLIKYVFKSVL